MERLNQIHSGKYLAASDVLSKVPEVGEGVQVQLGPEVELPVVPDWPEAAI